MHELLEKGARIGTNSGVKPFRILIEFTAIDIYYRDVSLPRQFCDIVSYLGDGKSRTDREYKIGVLKYEIRASLSINSGPPENQRMIAVDHINPRPRNERGSLREIEEAW